MKAVILAAGKGTRLGKLTDTIPKPLLQLHGEPVLEYILDGIAKTGITDICLVVGHQDSKIEAWINQEYLANFHTNHWRRDLRINFIHQKFLNGTGGALLLTKDWVGKSNSLVTYGDILLSWSVYKRILNKFREKEKYWCLVGNTTDDPSSGAAIYYKEDLVIELIEKPPKDSPYTDLNNAGCYVFTPSIFQLLEETKVSQRGEIELTDPIIRSVHENKDVFLVRTKEEEFWCDIGNVDNFYNLNKSVNWIKKIKNT